MSDEVQETWMDCEKRAAVVKAAASALFQNSSRIQGELTRVIQVRAGQRNMSLRCARWCAALPRAHLAFAFRRAADLPLAPFGTILIFLALHFSTMACAVVLDLCADFLDCLDLGGTRWRSPVPLRQLKSGLLENRLLRHPIFLLRLHARS